MNPEMTNSSSFPARLVASAAIVAGVIALIVVIASSTGGGGSQTAHHSHHRAQHQAAQQQPKEQVPATYTVQEGDTLSEIGHTYGVPVARIERLNPEVDPQILVAGETLKLK
jgi:LysM repeat protein